MSVLLEAVGKFTSVQGVTRPLLAGLNLEIGPQARIGILGLPKSGKSTLLRLICGTEQPDQGRIRRDLNISWPIPATDFMVRHSSLAWNIRIIARIYGVTDKEFARRVAELGGLSDYLNVPLSNCPPFVRQQLGFALGIGMDFDLYLFDNVIVPARKEFRETALERFRERTEGKAILLATGRPQDVEGCCDSVYVLEDGHATHFPELAEGLEYFKALQKAVAERRKELQTQAAGEDGAKDTASGDDDQSVEFVQAALSDL